MVIFHCLELILKIIGRKQKNLYKKLSFLAFIMKRKIYNINALLGTFNYVTVKLTLVSQHLEPLCTHPAHFSQLLPFLQGRIRSVIDVVGGSDLQGCGRDLHRGGDGAAGLGPRGSCTRGDAGELPEPALSGVRMGALCD